MTQISRLMRARDLRQAPGTRPSLTRCATVARDPPPPPGRGIHGRRHEYLDAMDTIVPHAVSSSCPWCLLLHTAGRKRYNVQRPRAKHRFLPTSGAVGRLRRRTDASRCMLCPTSRPAPPRSCLREAPRRCPAGAGCSHLLLKVSSYDFHHSS
jgi:hypothetical protein